MALLMHCYRHDIGHLRQEHPRHSWRAISATLQRYKCKHIFLFLQNNTTHQGSRADISVLFVHFSCLWRRPPPFYDRATGINVGEACDFLHLTISDSKWGAPVVVFPRREALMWVMINGRQQAIRVMQSLTFQMFWRSMSHILQFISISDTNKAQPYIEIPTDFVPCTHLSQSVKIMLENYGRASMTYRGWNAWYWPKCSCGS